uniref:lipase maturation factor 1-like n=1 Tax=Styela clava TaxID=7725 RepID=UPI001939FC67|nr:lipase maturation factor 1-like [Styela clava]
MQEADGLRRRKPLKEKNEEKEQNDRDVEDDAFDSSKSSWAPGTFWFTRILFLRFLGFIYFTAFFVALQQNIPLIGKDGILPASKHMLMYENYFKNGVWQRLQACPTLLWFVDRNDIDWWLSAMAYAGLVISAFLIAFGASNIFMMFTLWVLYHSIVNVGQTWYGFGWESQLLETGFLAIFFCPLLNLKPYPKNTPTSKVVIYGYLWLIFRIMIGAGLIKIRGDKCWRDLTCMNYHYQTQPVPNPISYFLHQSPNVIHKLETAGNHIIELIVPFFLILPRKLRMLAGASQILFQVILVISGNLSFLNWLTILPSICCFDDASLSWMFSTKSKVEVSRIICMNDIESHRKKRSFSSKFRSFVNFLLFCLITYLSVPVVMNILSSRQAMNRSFDSLRIVNTYGAFGSVTKTRTEVILQGTYDNNPNSDDAVWLEYEFKCKPGNITRRPCIISPYHYRLDWLMWFAAFQNAESNPWFIRLIAKLLENDPNVTKLIENNPFANGKPPKFIRAEHYKYQFTKIGSNAARDGKWWRRKKIGSYLPPVNMKMLEAYLKSRGFDVPRLS